MYRMVFDEGRSGCPLISHIFALPLILKGDVKPQVAPGITFQPFFSVPFHVYQVGP